MTKAKVAECKICEINLYNEDSRNKLTPAPDPKIFPCAIGNCPYETIKEQKENSHKTIFVPAGKWGSHFD